MAKSLGEQLLDMLMEGRSEIDKQLMKELMRFDKSVLVAGLLLVPVLNRQSVVDFMRQHENQLKAARKSVKELNLGWKCLRKTR